MSSIDEQTADKPSVPWRMIAIVSLLVIAASAVGRLFSDGSRPSPPMSEPANGPTAPATNGPIAYSYEGEIFLGDLVTGRTRTIISGPGSGINPIFSPNGRRIAFWRHDPSVDESIVVVQADGSDERLVWTGTMAAFAWTPDSASLVVEHDGAASDYWDGFLSLIDASGMAEPRRLTPPLAQAIGAMYFNPSSQMAPMFRPPDGDLILEVSHDRFVVFDATLTSSRELGGEALTQFEPWFVRDATWSPDGTMIAMMQSVGLVVMNADGSDVRDLSPPGLNQIWSPDSSSIAYEATGLGWHLGDPEEEVRIAVIDVASGTERVLESSVSRVKRGAAVETITNNTEHTWYYEGWSWSPDGQSLLLLKDHRTRPVIVDVATDTATELPWEADSNPSWQRIGTG